jgi:hypothetical protein
MTARVPGHVYQQVGICQCQIRTNDSLSGRWNSLERVGVIARLKMTPAQHAEHIASMQKETSK